MNKFKITLLSVILIVVFLTTSCGFVTDLKVALASSGPLVSILASKGIVSQAKADAVTRDFGDAVNVVATLDMELKAAINTAEKLVAAQEAERAWRAIYARGHFGVNSAILDAANIADAIFSTIVAYYGGQPTTNAVGTKPKSNKELQDYIKAQTKALKEKLQVK